jgi:hypothetical protein
MSYDPENFQPCWLDEDDWLVCAEFIESRDEEEQAQAAETIGYLSGYASLTNTRMLALRGGPDPDDPYELLFSFDSTEHKDEFLSMTHSNELTDREPDDWTVPTPGEIQRARPLDFVIPKNIMDHAQITAVALMTAAGERGKSN